MSEATARSVALLGAAAMARLKAAHVLVVGVGGVGSWCAEALVRTGIGAVTLVDDDLVAVSNLNRQCPALAATVGRAKVEAMRERLLAIAPDCRVTARAERYAGGWDLSAWDAVADAIDSVAEKAELVLAAVAAGIPLVSSMGAALRLDPTRVRRTRFEKVTGDGLARALRNRFRRLARTPGRFDCVWSDEAPRPTVTAAGEPVRGSLMSVTATFGMCLAAGVIDRLVEVRGG